MQIFYYISMKCVQNDYLVLPLEWGGNRAEWGVERFLSAGAHCKSSPSDLNPHSSDPTLGPQPL